MNNAKIGNFIRTLRKEKNLTQKELAEKLDITDRAISRWERGIGCPDISLLEQLANTLDISILELLKGEKIKEHNHPNELDLLESMSLSKNNTLNKFKTYTNYFTIITITLFILFILITNLKSILLETKTFHFKDFYEQPTEKTIQKLNNQIELILTNQGIYSKEDYSTIKT